MLVFHHSFYCPQIMKQGFKDGSGSYGFGSITLTGCWVSDIPADIGSGADGDNYITAELPNELFEKYELRVENDDGELLPHSSTGFREACIPAIELNRYQSTFKLCTENEASDLADELVLQGTVPDYFAVLVTD